MDELGLLKETVKVLEIRARAAESVTGLLRHVSNYPLLFEEAVKTFEAAFPSRKVLILILDDKTKALRFHPPQKEEELSPLDEEDQRMLTQSYLEIKKNRQNISKNGYMAAPLKKGELLLGAAAVFSLDKEKQFEPVFLQLLETLSRLLIEVIDLSGILHKLTEDVAGMSYLLQASEILSSTMDKDALLEQILGLGDKIVKAEGCSILLKNEDGDSLNFIAVTGPENQKLKGVTLSSEEGVASWVFKENRPALVNDVTHNEYFSDKVDQITGLVTRNLLATPLKIGDYVLGVMEAFNKQNGENFLTEDLMRFQILSNQAALAIEKIRLYGKQKETFSSMLKILSDAIESRDPEFRGHCERVEKLSMRMAGAYNMAPGEKETLSFAALLHDIGKIGIPDEILNKTAPLLEADWDIVREHPRVAARMLSGIKELENVIPLVLHHQEYWDGKGYPDRLDGENIPLGARIIAVADSYDVMTNTRPYIKEKSRDEAILELRNKSGTQFDPRTVEIFVKILEGNA
ncbi:MAG TPA: HD domain-containing phosphohydrolase [bacterium]|nr:HD domain-containing phosphohydrolase [bacterium]